MVAVRVADFGCGGAAPPPGGGGAAPCTARAAGNFGGLTGLEASFVRKPGPQFRNVIINVFPMKYSAEPPRWLLQAGFPRTFRFRPIGR